MKKQKMFAIKTVCLTVIVLAFGLALVSCDDGGSASGSSGNPYRVTYHAGEGAGVPPFPQVVGAGHIIELPGQETMTHPSGKALSGWESSLDGTVYNPYDRYPVYADVDFTAQWGTPPKLSAPMGVTAAVLSPTSSIRVTWNEVYGATSYDVYYTIGSSTSKNFAGNVSNPPFTHNGLQPNTVYCYYIKAKNGVSESAFSSSAEASIPPAQTPPAQTPSEPTPSVPVEQVPSVPTNVAAAALSSSSIRVTWNPVSGATSYDIYYSDYPYTAISNRIFVDTVASPPYIHNGLRNGTAYYYSIKAKNSAGESAFSAYAEGRTIYQPSWLTDS